MGSRSNAQRPGRADVPVLSLEVTVVVEDLNSIVRPIGHIHHALGIDLKGMDRVELARRRSTLAPRLDELAHLVELRDSRVAVSIGDEDVAGRVPRHIGRPIEVVAWDTHSLRRGGRGTRGPAPPPPAPPPAL